MNTALASLPQAQQFELRYPSLFKEGRGYAFPCDAEGHVDINLLPERARANYLLARKLVGREFSTPRLQALATH